MWATWPSTPPSKQKNVGNRGENVIFSFGPKAIQMERKLKPCDAHGQLHTKLGPAETQHEEHCFKRSVIDSQRMWKILVKNGRFEDFGLGWPCPHLEAIWTSTWPPNGSNLGPNSGTSKPSWGEVGGKWAQVGPGDQSRPIIETAHLDNVGPICKPQSCALFGFLSRANVHPPAEAAPVNRGLFESIGSAPKLSRLGTFGAGGFYMSNTN